MRSRLALVTLAGLFAASRPGSGQEPQPKPEVVIPVGTEVVRVDVIVTDKGGKPRPGFKREDFEILEDGTPQPITSFEVFTAPSRPPAPKTPAAVAAAAEAAPAGPARAVPRRFVVLAVDDIHIEASNLIRLKKTLDRFLEVELPPDDIVALVTTSGARSQEFTDDRHTLRQAVARLTLQDRRSRPMEVPYITAYQAELIERGDPEALGVAVEEILQRRGRTPNPQAEARMVARAVLHQSVSNARITFETIGNVMRGMSALPGRKVVVFVSDGFTSGFGVQSRAALDLREVTDAGTRSGVIVYALDSRGLQANTNWSAANRGPSIAIGGGAMIGARERLQRSEEFATQDAMNAMAADTGGFLVANTNSFGDALKRIIHDTDVYYLLAYEPTNTRRDGEFRKIEVRLPGAKDVRVRHRRGYFGPKDLAGATLASASPGGGGNIAAASPLELLRAEMRTALTSPAPLADLPVSMSADFVSVGSGVTQVAVSGFLDLHHLPFAKTGERRLATVDVAGAVFDESGAVVGSLALERATLDLTNAAYEKALQRGLSYQRTAPLKPGRYRVSVAVREEGSGKVGNAQQWVDIPDLAQGAMTLSSLFLMKEEAASPQQGKGTEGSGPSLRAVQANRDYGRDESLYVQFFAYNLEQDADELVTQTEIWRGDQMLAASAPEPLDARSQDGSATAYTRKIKLKPFGPGDYEVRIVVTDPQSDLSASQRARFSIE